MNSDLQLTAKAEKLGRLLLDKKLTIGCAESCTGGLLTSILTDVPGSSAYVLGSIVSYTNQVKMSHLGVKPETLAAHTAVSEETAREMACGILNNIESDLAVSVTGMAGPGGGTDQQPVGLVYICVASPKSVKVAENYFIGDRAQIKRQAVAKAIDMALECADDY